MKWQMAKARIFAKESSAVYLHPLKAQQMGGFPGEACPGTSGKQEYNR